jgi:methanogen homocitrate synthase
VAAGAEVVHASLAGLGERTGNTPLEEVAVALRALLGVQVDLNFAKLTSVVRETANIANFPLAPNKPVIGERAFTRESGMGVDLIRKAPMALFCLNPAFVGQEAQYVLGKKSGIASIEMKIADLGLGELSGIQQKEILQQIKGIAIEKKGLVTDTEFVELVERIRS